MHPCCTQRQSRHLCHAGKDCQGHQVPPKEKVQAQSLNIYIVLRVAGFTEMTSDLVGGQYHKGLPSPARQSCWTGSSSAGERQRLMITSASLENLNATWLIPTGLPVSKAYSRVHTVELSCQGNSLQGRKHHGMHSCSGVCSSGFHMEMQPAEACALWPRVLGACCLPCA